MLLFPSPALSQLQDFHQLPPCEQPVHFFFPPFPCHHPASCCHFISGKVAGRSFPWVQQTFLEHLLGVSGSGGGDVMMLAKSMSVLSCVTSLTSNFFSLQLCFYSLRPCWPSFLLSPCPTSVLQYCLCGSFLLFRRRCVLQSVLPLFSGCGDVFKVTFPSACSFNCLEGGGKRVNPGFWLILAFQESVCLPNINYVAACWSKN